MAETAAQTLDDINRTCERLKKGLSRSEQKALYDESKYPLCERRNIIWRKWRNDFVCGWCKAVFVIIRGKGRYLGNQSALG